MTSVSYEKKHSYFKKLYLTNNKWINTISNMKEMINIHISESDI